MAGYDALRQASIEALGIRFLRFTNNQVKYDLANVLKCIGGKVKEIDPTVALRLLPL
jgi:very-short-patch-repair endonuclease